MTSRDSLIQEQLPETMESIPIVFKECFPQNFVNDVNGWGSFSKQILRDNFGQLLSLDIDYGTTCSLNCPHCFRKSNYADTVIDGRHETLDHAHILKLVREAKQLGLRSVKFLGAGEPFEAETTKEEEAQGEPVFHFLEFLRELKSLEITPAIFTKGHVIGDDELVEKYYSRYGISTGRELVKELKRVDASILLGFNSFDAEIQDAMVGTLGDRGKVRHYTEKRNRCLELLVKEGFNDFIPDHATHLCLAVNPITKKNYEEAFKIYEWARVRNIYAIVCPTMISGICSNPDTWRKINPTDEQLIDLYTKIYQFNIQRRIQTLEQIKEEGVSAYAGGHPCNQIACGMYITRTGTVLRCPGDDTTILGNTWEQPLKEIWINSENYCHFGRFNCGCPPKWGKSIPRNLFTEVIVRLEAIQKGE